MTCAVCGVRLLASLESALKLSPYYEEAMMSFGGWGGGRAPPTQPGLSCLEQGLFPSREKNALFSLLCILFIL